MIRYSLACDRDHGFDSWFQNADACDGLLAAAKVACVVCGSTAVRKAIMSPAISSTADAGKNADLRAPQSPAEQALAAMRRHIEENSEYVGMNFAAEARAIHDGDAPERSIYGEARGDEARRLLEDGVPVAPLPFLPQRRVN